MTRATVVVQDDVESAEDLPSAAPVPAAPRPGVASLLGQIGAAVDEGTDDSSKLYPVGKIKRLSALYRPLLDDEREALEKHARDAAKLRKKTGAEQGITETDDLHARVMVKACVELVWTEDDGTDTPVHEILARPEMMGDDAPSGPQRYDRSFLKLFLPDRYAALKDELGREPSSLDVVRELHRSGRHNHAPLRTYGQLLQLWMTGVSTSVLEDALEGS